MNVMCHSYAHIYVIRLKRPAVLTSALHTLSPNEIFKWSLPSHVCMCYSVCVYFWFPLLIITSCQRMHSGATATLYCSPVSVPTRVFEALEHIAAVWTNRVWPRSASGVRPCWSSFIFSFSQPISWLELLPWSIRLSDDALDMCMI